MRHLLTLLFTLGLSLQVCTQAADALQESEAVILSEGVRMRGTLYLPADAGSARLPAVAMAHGWGGTAGLLKEQARGIARAGYAVLAFDYRGWGASDSRVILVGEPKREADSVRYEAQVQEIREVVDPLDQTVDWFNALHWLAAHANVDAERIGIWGSSLSGGMVAHIAAYEPRVKALVSQVGWFGTPQDEMSALQRAANRTAGSERARGERGYPAPRAREVGNLIGAPIGEKFLRYAPIQDIARIRNCASLFIAAENEELFDNHGHPELAHKLAPEPKRYVVIPGIKHYGIYREARDQATQLAVEWLDRYLKTTAKRD